MSSVPGRRPAVRSHGDRRSAPGDGHSGLPFFNARAQSGYNYRVLANVWTPQGLSGAALPPGASTTGKICFDVVGDVPNSVVYNDGSHDLPGWVDPPVVVP